MDEQRTTDCKHGRTASPPTGGRPAALVPPSQREPVFYLRCDNCDRGVRPGEILRKTYPGKRFLQPGDCTPDEHVDVCPECKHTETFIGDAFWECVSCDTEYECAVDDYFDAYDKAVACCGEKE